MNHRFVLRPYKLRNPKYRLCPDCGRRSVVPYFDEKEQSDAPEPFGKCERVSQCGYNKFPTLNNIAWQTEPPPHPKPIIAPSLIDPETVSKTLGRYQHNNLFLFLESIFGHQATADTFNAYHIGTAKGGRTIFWQTDIRNSVRTGKIMLYDPTNGRRAKKPYGFNWVHAELKLEGFNLIQCLFGLHLTTTANRPIAIVESEKTALISSIVSADFLWLATGGLQNLTPDRLEPIRDRHITLFPDLDAFEQWHKRASLLSASGFSIEVRQWHPAPTAAEIAKGYDIADYLMPT